VSGQLQAQATLRPPSRYSSDQRMGGPQSRSVLRGEKNILDSTGTRGASGSVVIKALCYKPKGRGFDSR
jgi:hypothetical protein